MEGLLITLAIRVVGTQRMKKMAVLISF